MSESPNAELIATFYQAFDDHDADTMVACYAPDVVFTDPAFGELRGEQAADMWRMLIASGTDLRVKASGIRAAATVGSCHWDADYTFSLTRRKVHNSVDATFEFRDGLIVRHTDDFDFRTWAGQALTPVGGLLAWTPFVQIALRVLAKRNLAAYHAKMTARRSAGGLK
ncbi:MAG: nuclear transport factor 2 family protein [Actinomycetes bacterium]